MFEFDELKIYRGSDIKLQNPNLVVTIPTLDQIERFGERRYFSAISTLTAVGADMKWQLWDEGIDYTQIEDYDLFTKHLSKILASKKRLKEEYPEEFSKLSEEDQEEALINPLQLVLKDIDLADFALYENHKSNQIVLYDPKRDLQIDRMAYSQIVEAVRKIHGYKRNNEIPANERTKMDLIEDARDDYMANKSKPYKSILKPLISALTVKSGMCGDDKIWNMNICMFFDNLKRAGKIQDAQLLLQGAYSGFANLKGVDRTRLDWAGDI